MLEKVDMSMLNKIKKIDPQLTKNENRDDKQLTGFYVFFSFDLVNSTLYKTQTQEKWPQVFSHFYEYAREKMKGVFPGIELWKYVGDEILFFLKVTEKGSIYNLCQNTLDVQRKLINSIYNNFIDSKGILYIKSTIWSADVETIESGNISTFKEGNFKKGKNLVFYYLHEHGINFDFLGPDIDIGFRISEYSEKSKMVVGAELAYLLYKHRAEFEDIKYPERIEDQLKIVSFEKLKGIWNGRKYPIIWYSDEWYLKEDMFEYDERYNSKLVENIFKMNFKLPPISFLQKVLQDTELNEKATGIAERFKKGENAKPFNSKVISRNQAEVHCVSICIKDGEKILIAKRKNRKKMNEKWEFGCGSIILNQNFEESIKLIYQNEFNIKISPQKKDNELIPIATYTYTDSNDIIVPGIIFVSEIIEGDPCDADSPYCWKDKYSEVKLINYEEIKQIARDAAVPLFHDNVKKALSFIQE